MVPVDLDNRTAQYYRVVHWKDSLTDVSLEDAQPKKLTAKSMTKI